MKILYHHRTASRDGQSTHFEEMIGGLRANGHTVREGAPSVEGHNPSGGSAGWVGRLKAFLPQLVYELAELAYSLVAYRRLVRNVREFQPDCIYERYNLYLLAGVWVKNRFGLPLILELYVWKNADVILPVTQVLANHMVSKGVESRRIRVIPNAVNEKHYADLPSCEEAKAALGLTGRVV